MRRSRLFVSLGVMGAAIISLPFFFPKSPVNPKPVPVPIITPITPAPTTTSAPTLLPTVTVILPASPTGTPQPQSPPIPATVSALPPHLPATSAVPSGPPSDSTVAPTPARASPTRQPTSTRRAIPSATPASQPLAPATVARVIDGDTIDVVLAGKTMRVRIIGVDSPETNKGPICYGKEATAHAQSLLDAAGGKLWLEKDVSETDRYGRLLRYVWLDPAPTHMLNEIMVADGYAQVSTYPPDVKYVERFISAERAAKSASLGLWGACPYFGAPASTPTTAPLGAYDGPYDPNGPDRDCSDFATQAEAQRFFIAAGGPARDPHHLDRDHDGIACENLP